MLNRKESLLNQFTNVELTDELKVRYIQYLQNLCNHTILKDESAIVKITDRNHPYYGRKICLVCGKIL